MSLDNTDTNFLHNDNQNENTSNIRIIERNGKKIVEIDTILFSGKRKIDWESVCEYLKKYVGESYVLDELDELVYIGKDFPYEFTHSMYNGKTFGTLGKARANSTQAIPELIKTAGNTAFYDNLKSKHDHDAKNGWYRCTVYFSIPTTDDKGNITGKNLFQGRMIIRKDSKNKNYLYDIINIKKET